MNFNGPAKERWDNMDNFAVHVTARDPETFRSAFRLAFQHDKRVAICYAIKPLAQVNWMFKCDVPAMVLYWADCDGSLLLPYKMDVEAAMKFVEGWLATVEYPEQPDHDGDNEKGFILSTGDFWGHVEGHWQSILAVQPCWALLGK